MQDAEYTALESPELLLQNLNAALRELRGAVEVLADTQLCNELTPAMRSLLLAEVVGNESIIAIGGSQGAGKTSLLQAIYELEGPDAEWLKPNRGQGERMPVLVIEEVGRSKVEGAVRCLKKGSNGRFSVEDEIVNIEEFQRAVRDPEPSQLLPLLKVPRRYFQRPNQSWLLLPGYEKEVRQNRDWQRLMRQALVGASGCVIVTDATRMANQQQLDIVKDMLSNELRGAQTVVVVSKTEALRDNEEGRQKLRQTARDVFSIPPEHDDRWILCTGTDDEAYVREWLPAFADIASDIALSGSGSRTAQLTRLREVLREELAPIVMRFRTKAQLFFKSRDGGEGGQEVVERCLEAFDDKSARLRESYQTKIAEGLDTHLGKAREEMQGRLINDHEGVWNHLKDYLRTSSESLGRIESDISASWRAAGSVLNTNSAAIGQITTSELGAPTAVKADQEPKALQTKTMPQVARLGYESSTQLEPWKQPSDEDIHNFRVLFCRDSQGDFNNDLEQSITLLPALTLEYARVASLIPAIVGVDDRTMSPVALLERPALVGEALNNLKEGVSVGTSVLRGIATVLALDVAADGDVDVVGVLGRVFGVGSEPNTASLPDASTAPAAASAAVTGFGAAIIGAVAVGYLVHSAVQQVRLHDLKAAQAAHTMLRGIRDHHVTHFMNHYDEMMAKMREHLKQALRERYHLHEHLVDQDRLAKALADVRSLQADLLRQLDRTGQSLPLFNLMPANQ